MSPGEKHQIKVIFSITCIQMDRLRNMYTCMNYYASIHNFLLCLLREVEAVTSM
jgi:hypothetical protein